jgi:hypothetical protein
MAVWPRIRFQRGTVAQSDLILCSLHPSIRFLRRRLRLALSTAWKPALVADISGADFASASKSAILLLYA